MLVTSLYPDFVHFGAKVSWHYFLLGYEHVSLIVPGVGSRSLVEDHNGLLHMSVHEMQLEVGTNGLPP